MLFALLKQGNSDAFESIYNKYWNQLFKTAYKRLHDRNKCQDVVQNVFTDLWNRRTELNILNLQAYLHTAVRFQVLKSVSKQSRHAPFVDIFETEIISNLNADGALLDKEAKKLVEQFINALPFKRRNIFIRHYIDDLSTTQIASELNISQKTVQNQLTTAYHALRLRLTHLFSLAALLTSIHHR
ncbi:sigma-70 family RNA polymerase sigma factor [uncultured Mucilaginibacter sp.]|uniref:RNA polymerase sigma factor n=1 Tax=uncultured Mucilaginibacter sp. TaxID=797541 RepID=UPI0025DA2F20|nr:sigma-70 family RNA polymerase sigma factor [uncultured Mucilaginibacter sp.]